MNRSIPKPAAPMPTDARVPPSSPPEVLFSPPTRSVTVFSAETICFSTSMAPLSAMEASMLS